MEIHRNKEFQPVDFQQDNKVEGEKTTPQNETEFLEEEIINLEPDIPNQILLDLSNVSEEFIKVGGEMLKEEENKILQDNPKAKVSADLQDPATVLRMAALGGGRIMDALSKGSLTNGTETLGGVAIIELGIALNIGMKIIHLFENDKIIKKDREKIAILDKKIERSKTNPDKVKKLEKKKKDLQLQIEDRVKATNNERGEAVVQSLRLGIKGMAAGTGYASKVVQTTQAATGIASAVGANVFSVITIILSSKELYTHAINANKIHTEKDFLMSKLKANHDPVIEKLIHLRIQNLDKQLEENRVNKVRSGFLIASGTLGAVAIAKTVITALGLTIAGALGAAVVATGIGAAVLGALAIVIGASYFAYKKRHAIMNKLQNLGISWKEKTTQIKMNSLLKREKTQEAEFDKLTLAENNTYEKKIRLEKQINGTNNIFLKKILELRTSALASKLKKIGGKITIVTQIQPKIREQIAKLEKLNEERIKINETYRYGKDLAKFGKNANAKAMEVADLKNIHAEICPEDFNSKPNIQKIRDFFSEQNDRIGTKFKFLNFKKNIDKEKFWDLVMEGITSPV